MEKRNKIILIALIILTVIVVSFGVYIVINSDEVKSTEDAHKFYTEYTELNGVLNEASGKIYTEVKINQTNTAKYVTESEAVDLLKNKTGVIYFGFSTCPWCRSVVSTLMNVAEQKNEVVYYLDILNIRSTYEIKDGKLTKTKNGTEGYYDLLEILDEHLNDFILTDDEGNSYETGEKRLYAPTIVAFNNGKITSVHVGTVDTQESGYDSLTEDEKKVLEDIIKDLIDSKDENLSCTKDNC